jgi:pimeloyl-ACP methyl ester carboxylesterase
MPFVAGENAGPIEIYYEEVGEGVPVVLIGGLTSTVEIWVQQVAALAERYRVIMPDNRGSGRTRVPEDDGVRTPQRWAADIELLLDGLGLDRVHLVGASMGGLLVQEFALTRPERLRSLTVMCSTPGGDYGVPIPEETLRILVAGQAPGATSAQQQASLRAIAHPRSFETCPERLERYEADKNTWAHSPEEIARRQAGMGGWESFTRLPDLCVPTLVMTGDADVLVPPGNAEIIAGRIPGAELVTIPDTGHVFMIEAPDAVNAALLEFLGKH